MPASSFNIPPCSVLNSLVDPFGHSKCQNSLYEGACRDDTTQLPLLTFLMSSNPDMSTCFLTEDEGLRWEPKTGLPEPLNLQDAMAETMGRTAGKEAGLAKLVRASVAIQSSISGRGILNSAATPRTVLLMLPF